MAICDGGSTVGGTSPDGITWTARTTSSPGSWALVTYGNGKFVMVSWTSNRAAYSADGITWTSVTTSITSFLGVAFGNGVFVAPSYGSNQALVSSDGITWSARTLSETKNWNSIAFGGGVFTSLDDTSSATFSIY